MNKYLRILVMMMIILNVANNKYRNANLLVIVVGIGVVVAVLDTYLKPNRSKVLIYCISTVLLVLLWIALDQEWINPLMLI